MLEMYQNFIMHYAYQICQVRGAFFHSFEFLLFLSFSFDFVLFNFRTDPHIFMHIINVEMIEANYVKNF